MLALRTCVGDGTEQDCLAAFFSLEERGVTCTNFPGSSEEDFLTLRIVTFLNRMESKGRVEGEIGDLSEKMERELSREGSLKAGASLGLQG